MKILKRARVECHLSNTELLSTDIGPVIYAEDKSRMEKHIQSMRENLTGKC